METLPLSETLRAVSRACDVASARPYGYAQRVARAALRLAQDSALPETLHGDLLMAAMWHSAGVAGVGGDVARLAFADERPLLRLYPADAVLNQLSIGAPLDADDETRTGVYVRHHLPLACFPRLSARWLHDAGLPDAAVLVAHMLELDGRARLARGPALASGMLSVAYHMVSVRWLAASTAGVDEAQLQGAHALLDDTQWLKTLAGVLFEPELVELAQALWADEGFWLEMDATRTNALGRPTPTPSRSATPLNGEEVAELLGSSTFSANELREDVPDIDVAIEALLAPRFGAQLPLDAPVLTDWFRMVGAMIDAKTTFAPGHAGRVVNMTRELASLLEVDDVEVQRLTLGAWLYGVGKLALSSVTLEQSGGLSHAQRAQLSDLPLVMRQTLLPMKALRPVLAEAGAYAERQDGSGVPEGLRGDDIPLLGRLLAVVDTYEALIADRPYRLAYSRARALHILQALSGRLFDGVITDLLEGITRGEL